VVGGVADGMRWAPHRHRRWCDAGCARLGDRLDTRGDGFVSRPGAAGWRVHYALARRMFRSVSWLWRRGTRRCGVHGRRPPLRVAGCTTGGWD